jgi:cytochrome oxidase Cu insertion factor (SCO1/SenC/PrrC family)
MVMSPAAFGFVALALVAAAGALWLGAIREVRVSEQRPLVLALAAAAAGLGAFALLRGPGLAGGVAAGLALAGGALFFGLQLVGRQSRGALAVSVGRPILDFTAPDAEGRPFALAGLRGRPYLLKFFRGHW